MSRSVVKLLKFYNHSVFMDIWVLLGILVAFLFSISNIIDKIAISDEFKDARIATTLYGFSMAFLLLIGFFVPVMTSFTVISLSFLSGCISLVAVYLYYILFENSDVSNAVPLLSLTPLAVLIISYFLFSEVFTLEKYIGVGAILLGSYLLGTDGEFRKVKSKSFFFLLLGTILFFAMEKIILKIATTHASQWVVLFWISIPHILIGLLMFALHHPSILDKTQNKGFIHLIISNLLYVVGFIVLTFAISQGPVSLVSSLSKTAPFFVFVLASVMSIKFPNLIHEKVTKSIITKKFVLITLIVMGTILISS